MSTVVSLTGFQLIYYLPATVPALLMLPFIAHSTCNNHVSIMHVIQAKVYHTMFSTCHRPCNFILINNSTWLMFYIHLTVQYYNKILLLNYKSTSADQTHGIFVYFQQYLMFRCYSEFNCK